MNSLKSVVGKSGERGLNVRVSIGETKKNLSSAPHRQV